MRFVASRGAVAESHLEDVAGRCADAEVFLAVGAVEKSHREAKAKKKAGARCLTSRLCATESCCCGENEIRTRDTL